MPTAKRPALTPAPTRRDVIAPTGPGPRLAEAWQIPLARLVPNPDQPRRVADPDRLQELADDVAARGVLEPLIVRPLDGERYEIVAGGRRYLAAQMAGLSHVPCLVHDLDDATAREVALVENLQRQELDIEDEARYLKELHDNGMSLREIGAAIHKSYQYVNRRIKLIADPAALTAYRAGQLNLNQLIADSDEPAEPVAMIDLADTVTRGNTGALEEVRFLRSRAPGKPFERFQGQIRRFQPDRVPADDRATVRETIRTLIEELRQIEARLVDSSGDPPA